MGVTEQGLAAIVKTRGNQDVHVILRGGTSGPNFAAEHVQAAAKSIAKARPQHHPSIMIDCSRKSLFFSSPHPHLPHAFRTCLSLLFTNPLLTPDGNSQKNHNNQPKVVESICEQLRAGDRNITGVMIESHIHEGRQDVPPEGPQALKYGVSITDACVDWESTIGMLDRLNEVRLKLYFHIILLLSSVVNRKLIVGCFE